MEDGGGRRGTAGDGGKKRKTTENSGRRRGTAGDDGDDTISSVLVPEFFLSGQFRKRRDGTTECRPSSSLNSTCRATLENDRTGRQAAVRPRPGSGQTDCPVANTANRGAGVQDTGKTVMLFNDNQTGNGVTAKPNERNEGRNKLYLQMHLVSWSGSSLNTIAPPTAKPA